MPVLWLLYPRFHGEMYAKFRIVPTLSIIHPLFFSRKESAIIMDFEFTISEGVGMI